MAKSAFWKKPSNMTFPDLCIWFDKHFYEDKDRDDLTCYRYMYAIYFMLGSTHHLFGKNYYAYDNYAIYASNIIYMRFIKKWQNGERIKSLLNYAKGTYNFLKISYQYDTFKWTADRENSKHNAIIDTFTNTIRADVEYDYKADFYLSVAEALNTLPMLIKKELTSSQYGKDKLLKKRLYNSCLLTILNKYTLKNQDIWEVNAVDTEDSEIRKDKKLLKLYNKEFKNCNYAVRWRLDESYSDYILLVSNKCLEKVFEDIGDIYSASIVDDSIIEDVIGQLEIKPMNAFIEE